MIRGLYTSAAGMVAQQVHLDVASNNLANASTPGFQADVASQAALPSLFLYRFNDAVDRRSSFLNKPQPIGYLGTGAAVAEVTTIARDGQYRETGRELDFALTGQEQFFVIQTPWGERYTKNGAFAADDRGQLRTSEGYAVLAKDGGVAQADDPDLAGNLAVAAMEPEQIMAKTGDSLYESSDVLRQSDAPVLQGVLQQSNLSPVEAMVNLITGMRAYEAGQKAIQTQDQTLDKLINEVGRV